MLALLAAQTKDSYPNDPPGPTDAAIQDLIDDSSGGYAFLSADAIASVQYGGQGQSDWSRDFIAPKGGLDLAAGISGIRFRSRVPGTPVTVSAAIFRKDEPPVQLAAGGLSALSLTFMHNGLVAGIEPNLDFEDTPNQNTWTLTDNSGTQTLSVQTNFTSPAIFPGLVEAVSFSTGPQNGAFTGTQVAGTYIDNNGRITNFTAGTNVMLQGGITTDTTPEFQLTNRGQMSWGPGTGATDTSLSRLAAGALGIPSTMTNENNFTTAGLAIGTAGRLTFSLAAAANTAFWAGAVGDTTARFSLTAAGVLAWGPGNAAADAKMQRLAAGVVGDSSTGLSTGPTGGGIRSGATGVFLQNGSSTGGGIWSLGANIGFTALDISVQNDTNARLVISAAAVLQFGPGNATVDTTVQRIAAGVVQAGVTGQGGRWAAQQPAASGLTYSATVDADTVSRYQVFADGTIKWGPGNAAVDLTLARTVNTQTGTGTFLELLAGAGLGYGTGTGGAATIATGASGTINKPSGKVTGSAGIAAGNVANYTVLCSPVGANDVVIACVLNGSTGLFDGVYVTSIAAGTFTIVWKNSSAGTVTPVFNYVVIKGANS